MQLSLTNRTAVHPQQTVHHCVHLQPFVNYQFKVPSVPKHTVMSCCSCFDPPPPAGASDADKPGSFVLKVTLSTGQEVKVHALPTDTAGDIKRKVTMVHGPQPKVVMRNEMVEAPLCARRDNKWLPMQDSTTMHQLGMQNHLKYADITDQLSNVKQFANVHWAASNFVAFSSGF